MRRLSPHASLVLLCLLLAAPASAQLPLPPLPTLGLPTHVDPFSIGVTVEVPGPDGGSHGKPLDTAVPVDANAVAQSEPTDWCGDERSTDDTADAASNGTYRFHLVYVYPSDGVDRFESFASQLQSDAFQASGLLEREYSRAIRYDMGTSCGSQYIDISSLRLPQSTADLQSTVATPDATFNTVASDLRQAG